MPLRTFGFADRDFLGTTCEWVLAGAAVPRKRWVMTERVCITREPDGVAHVELSRSDKLNALDVPMLDALSAAIESLADDRSVRCVVLSGQGRAFCAGLDFAAFMALAGEMETVERFFSQSAAPPANRAQHVSHGWTSLAVPVIAAVHGVAYGGGLQIALGADIRIAAPDARLSVMEIKYGLIPDMGGSQTLRRLVRLDVAKELTFTGRVVSGTEAAELGLVTRLAPDPLAAAKELARSIAARSPDAVRAAKRLLNETVQLDMAAGFALEADLQRSLLGSANQLEAVQAAFQKRPGNFSDPA